MSEKKSKIDAEAFIRFVKLIVVEWNSRPQNIALLKALYHDKSKRNHVLANRQKMKELVENLPESSMHDYYAWTVCRTIVKAAMCVYYFDKYDTIPTSFLLLDKLAEERILRLKDYPSLNHILRSKIAIGKGAESVARPLGYKLLTSEEPTIKKSFDEVAKALCASNMDKPDSGKIVFRGYPNDLNNPSRVSIDMIARHANKLSLPNHRHRHVWGKTSPTYSELDLAQSQMAQELNIPKDMLFSNSVKSMNLSSEEALKIKQDMDTLKKPTHVSIVGLGDELSIGYRTDLEEPTGDMLDALAQIQAKIYGKQYPNLFTSQYDEQPKEKLSMKITRPVLVGNINILTASEAELVRIIRDAKEQIEADKDMAELSVTFKAKAKELQEVIDLCVTQLDAKKD